MVYCVKLSGDNLWHCLNKIESVGFRKYSYYDYLAKKVLSQ